MNESGRPRAPAHPPCEPAQRVDRIESSRHRRRSDGHTRDRNRVTIRWTFSGLVDREEEEKKERRGEVRGQRGQNMYEVYACPVEQSPHRRMRMHGLRGFMAWLVSGGKAEPASEFPLAVCCRNLEQAILVSRHYRRGSAIRTALLGKSAIYTVRSLATASCTAHEYILDSTV